jgi:hypothetical protein
MDVVYSGVLQQRLRCYKVVLQTKANMVTGTGIERYKAPGNLFQPNRKRIENNSENIFGTFYQLPNFLAEATY